MYYIVIKPDEHLRTRGNLKIKKNEPQGSVFFISRLVFSNVLSVSSE